MGYFDALEKCARSGGAWSAWRALSGADYAANSDKCVVYRVRAHYDSADTALRALAVGTNFVNPLSSGNPSSACCYLYTSDPTDGSNAAIAAPPGGYAAMSGPVEFTASNVGHYLTFAFPAMSVSPEWLYFWFTSSVKYENYGTNQIYHYATGNWSDTYQTGTRTPAITGGLSGTIPGTGGSTGGGVGFDTFTLRDLGTHYNLARAEKSFTMTMGVGEVGRLTMSFSYAGQTDIRVTSTGESATSHLFFSDSPEIDIYTGRPKSILREFDTDGYLTATVLDKGKTYYVFAVCSGGATSGSVSFTLSPGEKNWAQGASATYTRAKTAVARAFSLGKGKYATVKISFAFSGTARFYTTGTTIDESFAVLGYLSEIDSVDEATGEATSPLVYAHGDIMTGDPADYDFTQEVTVGKDYYLVTRSFTADSELKTTVHIIPPEEPGVAHICVNGEIKAAEGYVYTGNAWRAVSPRVYALGAWHTGI